ncbi:uncharacterized protein BP5553_03438 [Venustampulla echinocandica]|uniref:Type 1 phosphatases regulator n=1 Tax=Venustampulla echinocandica TaxID=2656787 RepID=A0A370TUD3_9HELO|nr:uncharacterized protein BP5553_03438 [Venustampulla echinocandica]RDL39098.1 hypothetical protein BP5553_03438 [Venustampulla echinocandica]
MPASSDIAFGGASQTATSSSNPTGSATQVTPAPGGITVTGQPVLHLRGASIDGNTIEGAHGTGARTGRRTRIQWAEDVVDNEGLGRKKSKVCCIYHPQRGIDESSDESSSDSSSDDSDSGDDGAARVSRSHDRAGGGRGGCGPGHDHDGHGHKKGKKKARAPSPNAYEKMPKVKGSGSVPREQR